MRLFSLFTGIALAMSVTGTVLAAPPPSVTGLRAEVQDGLQAVLHWDQTPGDIAYYRVYYSATSILEHQGQYDDFDQTPGPIPEYTLEGLLRGENMYVAIMAVNMTGEESEFFGEEVMLSDTGATASTVSAPTATAQEPVQEEPIVEEPVARLLELLSADAIAPTQVRLTFSEPLQIRAKNAKSAFVIRQTGGDQLEITAVAVEGTSVTLSTSEQRPGVVYELRLEDVLTEQTGLRIDDANRVSLFTGYGSVETKSSTSSAQSSAPSDGATQTNDLPPVDDTVPNIRGLSLQAEQTAPGLYTVRAEWDASSVSPQITFLLVGQSFDGGRTVRNPYLLPANALSATVSGVPSGRFGMFIQAMDTQGRVSPGVFESAVLGETIQAASIPAIQASSDAVPSAPYPQVSSPSQPQHLPQSGATALLSAFALAGGLLGWQKSRGKKVARA